jgi:hypothetical protein
MIWIKFDQVMLLLIYKSQKRSQFFRYFAFFSIRKAANHMIFPFRELLKYCPQLLEMSHDQAPHDQSHMIPEKRNITHYNKAN